MRIDEAQAPNVLPTEIKTDLNLDIEIHPSGQYPILAQSTINHGYKLYQKTASPNRIMSLVICPLDDDSGQLNPETQERIRTAIQQFWDGKTTERHTFVDTTK